MEGQNGQYVDECVHARQPKNKCAGRTAVRHKYLVVGATRVMLEWPSAPERKPNDEDMKILTTNSPAYPDS